MNLNIRINTRTRLDCRTWIIEIALLHHSWFPFINLLELVKFSHIWWDKLLSGVSGKGGFRTKTKGQKVRFISIAKKTGRHFDSVFLWYSKLITARKWFLTFLNWSWQKMIYDPNLAWLKASSEIWDRLHNLKGRPLLISDSARLPVLYDEKINDVYIHLSNHGHEVSESDIVTIYTWTPKYETGWRLQNVCLTCI